MIIATLVSAALLVMQPSATLRERIEQRIAQQRGAEAAVAFMDLNSGDTLFINADSSYHAASTMKVPVMIELFTSAQANRLAMNQGILLVNQFASIVDGSRYSLDPSADSDTTLYHRIGRRIPVDTLLRLMIARSSNLATNILIALVGADQTTRAMRALGAARIQVLRGVEDGKAFERGMNNTTTARDLAVIMRAIEEGKAIAPAHRLQMLEILLAQEFNEKIPAGVPKGVSVAHKTGEITAHSHDAGIVYPPSRKPYVLVVLTRGITDGAVADKLIADVSALVYAHATGSPP